jgi:hypothetical protein
MQALSESAIISRINRALRTQGEVLRRCRESSRGFQELGRFYVVNERNFICQKDVDLDELGRELGVLRPNEKAPE